MLVISRPKDSNVFDQKLDSCSFKPLTGWYRDGYCKTDENDQGIHTVCATMTQDVSTKLKYRFI